MIYRQKNKDLSEKINSQSREFQQVRVVMEKDKEDKESTECFLDKDEELSRKQRKLEEKEAERNLIKEML